MPADGMVIGYVHDPLGRRIAKNADGVITEKYLWQGLTLLPAVYNSRYGVLSRIRSDRHVKSRCGFIGKCDKSC